MYIIILNGNTIIIRNSKGVIEMATAYLLMAIGTSGLGVLEIAQGLINLMK